MKHGIVRGTVIAVAAVLITALAGCYESPTVSLNEPGVYKGEVDPLLAKLKQPELREDLRMRFRGQTDR